MCQHTVLKDLALSGWKAMVGGKLGQHEGLAVRRQCCGGVGGLMSDSSCNQNVLSSCILMSLDVAGEIGSLSNLFNIFCVFALFI